MKIIVAYDIGDNMMREAFAGFLKRQELERIRRSLFIGRGGSGLAKDIERMARRIIDPCRDCAHIFMLSSIEQTRVRVVGTPYNGAGGVGVSFVTEF